MAEFARWGPDALREGYARTPLTVMYDGTLGLGPKTLYGVIAGHLWGEAIVAWPSQARLAECCGVTSTETIRKWTRELEARGLVTKSERSDGSLLYELWVPLTPQRTEGTLPNVQRGPSPTSVGGESEEGNQKQGSSTALALSEPPVPPSPARRTKQRMTDKQASMQETLLLGDLPDRDANLMLEVVECLSKGAATPRSRLNRLNEMLDLLGEVGHEAWEYAMRKAAEKGTIRGVAYVRAVAKGYLEDPKPQPRARQLISDDGPTIIDEIWEREQRERAEALRREREGQA